MSDTFHPRNNRNPAVDKNKPTAINLIDFFFLSLSPDSLLALAKLTKHPAAGRWCELNGKKESKNTSLRSI
jgi:hypothetical protein